ncbi:hydrogenase maturation protease [Crocosphaera sp. XPORK-15E]|uniref:hydrogenase maturation protease n=1 Tax=Crocosphaera sp. XPORK-15E TaxID=3110247 RepID=UPI002B1EB01E|nr:hydrogenase maturation protease [Crocosphaera sp. XPORK-15E]MEA5533027.1 hydrogenase maturation protease [Crocosphaera sp. XPORK-15E]
MKKISKSASSQILIIGYGNTLRGDDGVGYKIAEIIDQWNLNNITSLAVHQLTPDLAEKISQVDTVIFIDAIYVTDMNRAKIEIKTISINRKINNLGHHNNPEQLLSLTQAIYQKIPLAYWILVPAVNFNFSESFSSTTQKYARVTLEKIKIFLSDQSLK